MSDHAKKNLFFKLMQQLVLLGDELRQTRINPEDPESIDCATAILAEMNRTQAEMNQMMV